MAPAHFGAMDTFAKNLRKRAEELGVSNAEIARRLGVSERRYAHYTRGDREPDLATLTRIAAVFRASTDELLGVVDRVEPSERDILLARLISAAEGLNERDLAILVAATDAAANFVKEERSVPTNDQIATER